MTIPQDLKDVLGQIQWAFGLAKRCKPYTPTKAETRVGWTKLRNAGDLRWGCKLLIVWQDEVDFYEEEFGPDWAKEHKATGDIGHLIALPGSRYSSPGEASSVVWVPAIRYEKEEGGPMWVQLDVLLANPQVAWVEVVK